jgi:hypothetical protein
VEIAHNVGTSSAYLSRTHHYADAMQMQAQL